MPELVLLEDDAPALGDAHWRPVEIPPWNGDFRLKLRAATRPLLDYVQSRSKRNPKYRRRSVMVEGVKKTLDGDPAAAWVDEFLIAVVEDWDGVDGNPPCDDEHKIKLNVAVNLVNWITNETALMAGVKIEAEEKN